MMPSQKDVCAMCKHIKVHPHMKYTMSIPVSVVIHLSDPGQPLRECIVCIRSQNTNAHVIVLDTTMQTPDSSLMNLADTWHRSPKRNSWSKWLVASMAPTDDILFLAPTLRLTETDIISVCQTYVHDNDVDMLGAFGKIMHGDIAKYVSNVSRPTPVDVVTPYFAMCRRTILHELPIEPREDEETEISCRLHKKILLPAACQGVQIMHADHVTVHETMIVFESCKDRVQNYMENRARNPQLEYFKAIDGREVSRCRDLNTVHNLNTRQFMRDRVKQPGKVGCNLSHQLLWKQCWHRRPDSQWFVIYEDDIVFTTTYSRSEIVKVAAKAENMGSHFVRLERSRPKYIGTQLRDGYALTDGFYQLACQTGFAAYMLDHIGLSHMIGLCPMEKPEDMYFDTLQCLNPLYYHNDMFTMDGANDATDAGRLGSNTLTLKPL